MSPGAFELLPDVRAVSEVFQDRPYAAWPVDLRMGAFSAVPGFIRMKFFTFVSGQFTGWKLLIDAGMMWQQ